MSPVARILAMVTTLVVSGCAFRGDSSDVGLIPVIAAISRAVTDGNGQAPRRSTERILSDLDSIPADITAAIDRRHDIIANTQDELLTVLGLAPYRSQLVILGTGDPLTPEHTIYYRKDAFISFRFDAIRQRILGQVRVVLQ